jgi:NADP-dependent 3-hydroxy acid dehydrogenase YdfG
MLARKGADVVLVARSEGRLEEMASEIEADHGVETLVMGTDVGEEPQVSAAVDAALDWFGHLDIVVSIAGIAGTDDKPINEVDLKSYRRLMRVNVDWTLYVAKSTVPHLAETAGNLIFVGSFDGHYPRPRSPTCAASKW